MRNRFYTFCLLLLLPFKLFAAPQFDQLVVFGDSLSDTGRIYDIFEKGHKISSLIPLLPKSPPYYKGRFSNGPIWVENLAATLNLKMINYAVGGSLAESFWDSGIIFPWSFDTMLDSYLSDYMFDNKKSQHLYVIWGGGNDYLNDRKNVDKATTKTVNSIKRYIDKLAANGVTHILVLNLPDLGRAPVATDRGPDKAAHMSLLVAQHNLKLAKMVESEKKIYAGKVDILFVDANYYFEDLLSHPEKYQMKDVSHACYTGGFTLLGDARAPAVQAVKKNMGFDLLNSPSLRAVYLAGEAPNPQVCANPDEYLFWDIIHPTQAAHKIIADKVGEALKMNGWVG